MRNIQTPFLFLIIILVFTGCVNTRVIRYETIVRQPKPKNYPIEIIDPANIKRPYKVIGIVQANAGKLHSVEDTIKHLKNAARKMGGDALIDLQQSPAKGGVVAPAGNLYVYGNVREIWSAKVIVWEKP